VVYRLDTPGVENQAITNAKIDTGAVSTQKVDASINNALVPIKGIIMYSGLQADIPANWAICDGNNGTPNLVNKFVVAAASFDVGTEEWRTAVDGTSKESGGAATMLLGTANLPSHNHGSGSLSASGGNHSHTYIDQYVVINNGYRPWPASNNDCAARNVSTGGNGSHTHSISGSTGNQGSGQSFSILPPYYALCYIMKA